MRSPSHIGAPSMLDTQQFTRDGFWRAMKRVVFTAISLHAIFAVVCWLLGAPQLAWVQPACIVLHLVAYRLAKKRASKPLLYSIVWVNVLGHTTLGAWILGIESGFLISAWILLPVLYTNAHRSVYSRSVLSVTLIFVFVITDIWLRTAEPLVTIAPAALAGIRYFNIGCFLLGISFATLKHAQNALAAEQQLRAAASTDSLTGLMNRRRMSDCLNQEFIRTKDHRALLSVMLLDIDRFKNINDQYGHAVGDDVLVRIGELLRSTSRKGDVVARWGGEEFIVMLPDTGLNFAHETAERIRRAIAETSVNVRGTILNVSVTIGVAELRPEEGVEAALHRADKALYSGKTKGRNRVIDAAAA